MNPKPLSPQAPKLSLLLLLLLLLLLVLVLVLVLVLFYFICQFLRFVTDVVLVIQCRNVVTF